MPIPAFNKDLLPPGFWDCTLGLIELGEHFTA
jgi:hypothetical protein